MKHLYKPFFIILLTLAAALCLSVFALAAEGEPSAEPVEVVEAPLSDAFTDLSYSENETALRFMIDGGFIAGYTDGTFRPGRSYTRLELAQLVTALCKLDTVSGYQSGFYDCELAGAEAIDAAVSNGLMTGRSIQSFDPYGNVLKAEMLGTLEKAAAYLKLDGFYDHASGSYTDWATDYTICTADEAMQSAYQLAQALALKAEAEAEAAAAEAAANAVSELTGDAAPDASGEMSSYDQMTASAEPASDTASAEPATDAPDTAADDADASAEPDTTTASAEPADTTTTSASGEASGEAANTAASGESAQQETSTPPAGVTTPASAAAAPAQSGANASDTTTTAPVTKEYDESDELRNEIKDKYADIRDSILDFLRDLLGK